MSHYLAPPEELTHMRSAGLPGEEYGFLQNKSRLEKHYGNFHSPNARFSMQSCQTASNRHSGNAENHLCNSKVAFSTRKALGESFNFTNESFEAMNSPAPLRPQRKYDGKYKKNTPIPKWCVEEFNRWCYEDDQAYDAVRYKDDMTPHDKAAWRKHVSVFPQPPPSLSDGRPISSDAEMTRHIEQYNSTYGRGASRKMPTYKETEDGKPIPILRTWHAVTELKSEFDWDSSDDEDEGNRGSWGTKRSSILRRMKMKRESLL